MLQGLVKKYKVWKVKRLYMKHMTDKITEVSNILDMITNAHEKYLEYERKEHPAVDVSYQKGRRDALKELFNAN